MFPCQNKHQNYSYPTLVGFQIYLIEYHISGINSEGYELKEFNGFTSAGIFLSHNLLRTLKIIDSALHFLAILFDNSIADSL